MCSTLELRGFLAREPANRRAEAEREIISRRTRYNKSFERTDLIRSHVFSLQFALVNAFGDSVREKKYLVPRILSISRARKWKGRESWERTRLHDWWRSEVATLSIQDEDWYGNNANATLK